jgi:hypothetical protein
VILPVLLGIQTAAGRRGPRGLPVLLVLFLVYCVLYVFTVIYLHYRWGAL